MKRLVFPASVAISKKWRLKGTLNSRNLHSQWGFRTTTYKEGTTWIPSHRYFLCFETPFHWMQIPGPGMLEYYLYPPNPHVVSGSCIPIFPCRWEHGGSERLKWLAKATQQMSKLKFKLTSKVSTLHTIIRQAGSHRGDGPWKRLRGGLLFSRRSPGSWHISVASQRLGWRCQPGRTLRLPEKLHFCYFPHWIFS